MPPTKRTWVKVRIGLFKDPKHRIALGSKVFLFLYMLDHADWQTGKLFGWKDKTASEYLSMPISTVTNQRQALISLHYITCKQNRYSIDLSISKWKNPKIKPKHTPNSSTCQTNQFILTSDDPGYPTHYPQGNQSEVPLPIDSDFNHIDYFKDNKAYDLSRQLIEIWEIKTNRTCEEKVADTKATANAFERANIPLHIYAQAIDDILTMGHTFDGPSDTLQHAQMLHNTASKSIKATISNNLI